jgi:hypothetical protein
MKFYTKTPILLQVLLFENTLWEADQSNAEVQLCRNTKGEWNAQRGEVEIYLPSFFIISLQDE